MAPPSNQKQWVIASEKKDLDGLEFVDAEVPKCGETEVLVKMHAASLNYRDLAIPKVCLSLEPIPHELLASQAF